MKAKGILIESKNRILTEFIIALFALALFMVATQEANADIGGICSKDKAKDKVTWTLSGDVLYITGTGEMADYEFDGDSWSYNQPWWGYEFKKVIVGEGVTSIGDFAFCWKSKVEEVILPESLKSIGENAFDSCGAKDVNEDPEVPERTLTINFPSKLESIGDSAFYGSGIKSAVIPKGVKRLNRVFQKSMIESIDLGEIEDLGDYTFECCPNLASVKLPKTLKVLGEIVFEGTPITELIIPEGVTSLGRYYPSEDLYMPAISYCKDLKKVVFPSTLDAIFEDELNGCDALEEIDFRGTEERWGQLTSGIDPNSPLAQAINNPEIKTEYNYNNDVQPEPTKKANTLKVKGKTAKIKYSKLKKKAQTIKRAKAIAVTKAQGKVTYKKNTVTYAKAKSVKMKKKTLRNYRKTVAKKIVVNAKSGKITVKKGLKKGTYKVNVKVKAAGNNTYEASAWKMATFKIVIR